MSLVNIPDISFASRLATDKIVRVFEGSFNTNTAPTLGGYIPYTSFSHGFTRPVFTKLQTSLDQVNWLDENAADRYAISYSTPTSIFVLSGGSVGVVYYRVLAFWIDDYDNTNPLVPPTVGSKSNVYFDSRLNYQKLAMSGEYTVPASSTLSTRTIVHNLGYAPNVRVYNEMLPNQVWLANYGGGIGNYWSYDASMVEADVEITNTTLVISSYGSVSSPASRVWYRIYYDG